MAHTTYERIAQKYYWKKMREQIVNVINRCLVCLRNENSRIWNHKANAIEINGIHDRVHIDLHFGLDKTAEGYIGNIVIIESMSDWPWIAPIKSKDMNYCPTFQNTDHRKKFAATLAKSG